MKKAAKILLLISGIGLLISGIFFLFIECRFLFSGDSSIFADPMAVRVRAISRLVASLFSIACGILPFFLFSKKDHTSLIRYLEIFGVTLFLVGTALNYQLESTAGQSPLYLVLPIRIFTVLYAVGAVLLFVDEKKTQTASHSS
jgi:hypothetical protein